MVWGVGIGAVVDALGQVRELFVVCAMCQIVASRLLLLDVAFGLSLSDDHFQIVASRLSRPDCCFPIVTFRLSLSKCHFPIVTFRLSLSEKILLEVVVI